MAQNRSPSSGNRGHVPPERPVTFSRKGRSRSAGIGGHVAPEYSALLADMLRSLAGWDLLLVMGSEAATEIVYELTGSSRLWNSVWHGPDRVSRSPPDLEHPLGSIQLRVLSAYFASLLWQTFFAGHHIATTPNLTRARSAARDLLTPLMGRWSREDVGHLPHWPRVIPGERLTSQESLVTRHTIDGARGNGASARKPNLLPY
jgi:hypothetical protein